MIILLASTMYTGVSLRSRSICAYSHCFSRCFTVISASTVSQATFTDKKFKHVSNSCLDFMKRLLVRDVRYRMSTGNVY